MAIPNTLRLIVVTPESTLLDEQVDSVRLPLFDGLAGIFPGRAPMIGRLGYGGMSVWKGSDARTWFVDGGFVQVADNVCSVLTNRAIKPSEIDTVDAARQLETANAVVPNTEVGFESKDRDLERYRQMIATAKAR